jgi:hypothetical protein
MFVEFYIYIYIYIYIWTIQSETTRWNVPKPKNFIPIKKTKHLKKIKNRQPCLMSLSPANNVFV